ncbi:MAG: sugar phosphate isomerase/epimerase family protein [Candidatus Hydrothermarchaeota archaeon]
MQIGAPSSAFYNELESSMKKAVEIGLDTIEVVGEGPHFLNETNIKKIKEFRNSFDLDLKIHAPFSDLNIASLNEKIREETLKQILSSIECSCEIKADIVNIHPGHLSPLGLRFPEKAWRNNIESMRKCAQTAKDIGVKLTFENLPKREGVFCSTVEEVKTVIEEVPEIGFTLDIGHAFTTDNPMDFFELKFDHLHLHDNDEKKDLHLPLGSGNIDISKVLKIIEDKKYSGSIILEAKNLLNLKKSLGYLRRLGMF